MGWRINEKCLMPLWMSRIQNIGRIDSLLLREGIFVFSPSNFNDCLRFYRIIPFISQINCFSYLHFHSPVVTLLIARQLSEVLPSLHFVLLELAHIASDIVLLHDFYGCDESTN